MTPYSLFCHQRAMVQQSLVLYILFRIFPKMVESEPGEGVDIQLGERNGFVAVTVEYGLEEGLNLPVLGKGGDQGWFDRYWCPPPL